MKGSVTRTDSLVSALADRIVSGELPPGTSLDETQLAQRFDVSRTPVREAIRQLATMGLIEARPHRGAIVARPAATRLRDMFFVMAELEAICVTLCARTMTRDQRRDLEAFHREMGALVRAGNVEGYGPANLAFHGRLYDGARNSYLAELAAATRLRLAPFRSAQLGAADRLQKSYEEHGAIVTAILRGDSLRAAAAIRQHLEITKQTWLELGHRTAAAPQPAAALAPSEMTA